MSKKYGDSPIQRNWNRMAELSSITKRTRIQEAEYDYRVSVQSFFASKGTMPKDYIPVGEHPK